MPVSPAETFITALFQYKADDQAILVWSLQGKRSYWFTDLNAACAAIERLKERDLYVGAGTRPWAWVEAQGRQKNYARGGEETVSSIVGLWCDLDYLGPAHKKTNLPPREEALRLLNAMPVAPSITVHTGHGYHGWWLFKEPWLIESPEERQTLRELSQRWNYLLRDTVRRAGGWDTDSTFDLDRIMRLPGTLNCQGEQPVYAEIVATSAWRAASPDDFYALLPASEPLTVPLPVLPSPQTNGNGNGNGNGHGVDFNAVYDFDSLKRRLQDVLVLSQDALPPAHKFNTLRDVNPKFYSSYTRLRRGMKDTSPSAYDQSLANFAAQAGWEPQEIVDLLLDARRRAGDDLKLERTDYYAGTVAKALLGSRRQEATVTAGIVSGNETGAALEHISRVLSVQVRRIVRYPSADGAVYYLETPEKQIKLGPVTNLVEQKNLRYMLIDHAGVYFDTVSRAEWPEIARLMVGVCEEVDLGDESTEEGQTCAWLRGYLEDNTPAPTMADAVANRRPFLENGGAHVFLDGLREWLGWQRHERTTAKGVGAQLRAIGARPVKLNCYVGKRATSRTVWLLPNDIA
jgi:putative DNA primase/helicase